jgi:type I restriction enzyme S subunit
MSIEGAGAMDEENKSALVPRLRFPEFREAEMWGSEFGGVLFDQVSNKDHNSDLPVLAITQEHGAVPRSLIDYHVSVADKSIEGYKVVEIDDFIISLRSFQGGIEYSRYKGICSPAYVILRLAPGHSADYFRHFLKTDRFIGQLTKNLEGLRDGKMVSYKQFSELKLPTPSQKEQQKIAGCLSSLDELITAETQKLDFLKAHKKGLMQQLFPREGETVPRLRFPEFLEAGEWKTAPLEKFFGRIRNGFVGTATPHYVPNGIPYLQGKNIKQGRINSEELVTISSEFHRLQKKSQLNATDVLMVQSGHVGECAVVGESFSGSNCHALIVLSPFDNVDSRFFVHYFYSPQGLVRIFRITTGNTIKHILASDLQVLAVTIPTYEEQKKIADCLSSLDDLISAQSRKIAALKAHKKGLMQQLFPVQDEEHA